ncbi:MAG: flavodoxin-dependent (E)-4-hydroxy-3-methylbut-2-enyl-diphosphate synthase [Armatimonadetes bacterium]|jgi:(E)-4-hydroxy-3-methylbut-2-enyl-diphosphate synthase|nr:flavodoxin-dependent (E)-4-hydroxy-3-methylbut-2-enyl-diphosphate synthase [Armatimonadota bacterium]
MQTYVKRKNKRQVCVGGVRIGGDASVSVQSMTSTATADVDATVAQIRRLQAAGCDIVRVAVPDADAAAALREIKNAISIPLVADIHFQYKLALASLDSGADKLRINPGNIGSTDKVEIVAKAAKERGTPIRIGVNSGSIDRAKYGKPTAEALVESGLDEVRVLEKHGFEDIVLSLKAFDVPMMIRAYQLASERCDYPLHLGVTEAGLAWEGTIRSSVGIGALLAEGIGDTIRVSLTADPVDEVKVGKEILNSLGLWRKPYTLVSCPTCGRCAIDIAAIADEVRSRLEANPPRRPLTVAVMGCVVNGPGEASMADVGIAGGKECGAVFARGERLRTVSEDALVDELMIEVEKFGTDS